MVTGVVTTEIMEYVQMLETKPSPKETLESNEYTSVYVD